MCEGIKVMEVVANQGLQGSVLLLVAVFMNWCKLIFLILQGQMPKILLKTEDSQNVVDH